MGCVYGVGNVDAHNPLPGSPEVRNLIKDQSSGEAPFNRFKKSFLLKPGGYKAHSCTLFTEERPRCPSLVPSILKVCLV